MGHPEHSTSCDPGGRVEWIDAVCDRYEDEWLAGSRPAIEDYLREAGSARLPLLRELVRLDADYRRRAGEQPAEYTTRYPELAGWAVLLPAAGPAAPPAEALSSPPAGDNAVTAGTGPEALVAGRYRLLGEIGRGGMGVVYRADEPALGRQVAVKLLRDRLRGDPAAACRFETEARITGRLQHPGVPPVFDLGRLGDGSPFLAMKAVEGRTLADMLADAGTSRAGSIALLAAFEQVCQTVAYAHSRGIIHRDLKTANVMVGAFGEVQVMDWGLAKFLDTSEVADGDRPDPGAPRPGELTHDGAVVGTPAFMAPEQARGEAGRADRRPDVFGLGGVLCAILTGKPPFGGADAVTTLRLAAAADLSPAFAALNTCGADPELCALCRRCLAPEAADRPADAAVVAGLVAAHRAGVEQRLRAAEREQAAAAARAAEQRKKRRWQHAAGVAAALLVLAGGVIALWRDREASDRREAALRRQADDQRRMASERLVLTARNQLATILTRLHVRIEDVSHRSDNQLELLTERFMVPRKGYGYVLLKPGSEGPEGGPTGGDADVVAGFLADPKKVEDFRRGPESKAGVFYWPIRARLVCIACHAAPAHMGGPGRGDAGLRPDDLMAVVRIRVGTGD